MLLPPNTVWAKHQPHLWYHPPKQRHPRPRHQMQRHPQMSIVDFRSPQRQFLHHLQQCQHMLIGNASLTRKHRHIETSRMLAKFLKFQVSKWNPSPWTGEALQVKNEKGIWVTWPNWLGAHEQPQDLPFPYSNGRTPGRFINPNLQCFIIFKNNFKFSVCTDGAGARTMLRMSQEHVLPLSMVYKSSMYCEGPGVGASSSALRFPDTRPGDDHQ